VEKNREGSEVVVGRERREGRGRGGAEQDGFVMWDEGWV